MDELIKYLEEIYELLEQILGITNNQGTILLREYNNIEEEDESIEMIQDMVTYKENLMDEVEKKEQAFQAHYNKVREQLKNQPIVITVQKMVSKILSKKEEIVQQEKNNLIIMQSKEKRHEVTKLPKQPKMVIEAYKKSQKANC